MPATISLDVSAAPAAPGYFASGRAAALEYLFNLPAGTLDGSMNVVGRTQLAIASGATSTIDLKTDTWTDSGAALGLVDCCLIVVTSRITNTTNVTIGAGASNGNTALFASSGAILAPGGCVMNANPQAGAAVGASTKTIDLVNGSGATATVDVLVIGRNA